MKILAIDSTATIASSAVCDIEDGRISKYCLFTLKNGLTHSESLLPLIDGAITAYGYKLDDIDLLAVSAGPGSFTGVRIGVATIKGLAYSGEKPVCGVSTLDALAKNCEGFGGVICPVMDARRGQFYNALFTDGVKTVDDRCVSFEEILADIDRIAKPVILCGDGAPLFKTFCAGRKDIITAPACAADQNALSVALCGYEGFINGKAVRQSDLKPIYLRASQAERMLNEKKEDKK